MSRKTAVRTIVKERLGLPDIRNVINALKLISIRKLKTSDHKWKSIIKSVYPKVLLFEQLGSSLPTGEHNFNKFWCHVFKAYKEFGEKIRLENSEELVAEPIFCNDNIRVGNRTVFQKSWIDNRVCYIKHILNENGTFMSFQSFKEKYRIKTHDIYWICTRYQKFYT